MGVKSQFVHPLNQIIVDWKIDGLFKRLPFDFVNISKVAQKNKNS